MEEYYTFLEVRGSEPKYALMGFVGKDKTYIILGNEKPDPEDIIGMSQALRALHERRA